VGFFQSTNMTGLIIHDLAQNCGNCGTPTKDPTPTDTATTQPTDLLPFIGGEHADAPKGIAFTLPDYLQLVDWTGRAVRDDKRGAIPAHIQPIFQRMGLNHEEWLEIVQNFGRRYRLAADAVDRLQAFSQQLGWYWLQGIGASRRLYQRPCSVPG